MFKDKQNDDQKVICNLATGESLEISCVVLEGEDHYFHNEAKELSSVLRHYLGLVAKSDEPSRN